MKIITSIYALMSLIVVSLFLLMYYVSGNIVCFIPVFIVIWDFSRAVSFRSNEVMIRVSRSRWSLENRSLENSLYTEAVLKYDWIEFIKEEEFKV